MGIDEFLVSLQVFHSDKGVYLIIGIDVEQVLDGTPLGIFGAFGNFVDLQPIAPSF